MIPDRIVQTTSSFVADKLILVYLTGRSYSSEPSGEPPSEPASTLLTYPGNNTASDVVNGGGAIAPSVPVQLLFWGDFWNGAGASLRDQLTEKVQELLAGPYTSALHQYGVTPPVYGGARVVTNWPVPTDPYSCQDVSDLVWNLIDNDGIFPDPDDPGGRNAYMAFMPPGPVPASPSAAGAHAEYSDFDLPFDIDKLWVAYVDYGRNNNGDVNTLTTSFAHELVELATDPEQDGWRSASLGHDGGEIGDICAPNNTNKTAWVGNVQVPAYWSARDQVCVIPTYPFEVRLDGDIGIRERLLDAEGDQSYPMGAPGSGLCGLLPACCFKGPYHWQRFQRREFTTARLRLSGYHTPQINWLVGGQPVSGSGSVTIQAEVTRTGPEAVTTESIPVSIDYSIGPVGLFIANNKMVGNFDVPVSVTVFDASASGGVSSARTASVIVSFIGCEFDWDQAFQNQQDACDQARLNFWKATHPANRGHVPIPIPDPQSMYGWLSARQVKMLKAALQEVGALRRIDKAAAQDLSANLLRRIGLPRNFGGDRQERE